MGNNVDTTCQTHYTHHTLRNRRRSRRSREVDVSWQPQSTQVAGNFRDDPPDPRVPTSRVRVGLG